MAGVIVWRIALIDNYDSYTYNLVQLLWEVSGREPVVVRNNEATVDELLGADFTHFVISPGPGTPLEPADFGMCSSLVTRVRVPCLGVCLGHQGLAAAFGGSVTTAPEVMHGRRSVIRHTGSGIFAGLPQGFHAVRYHSLAVRRPLGGDLVETAWADDQVLMGLAHRRRPLYGVQFHPESVETAHGAELVANFVRIGQRARASPRPKSATRPPGDREPLPVRWRRLPDGVRPEQTFAALYGRAEHSFWLDSASRSGGMSGHSYMGTAEPARHPVVRFYAETGLLEELSDRVRRRPGSLFDYLRLPGRRGRRPEGCPVPFTGGFVGYLAYGAKAATGLGRAGPGDRPDAQFLWADRFLGFDHEAGRAFAVAVGLPPAEAESWLDRTCAAVEALAGAPAPAGPVAVSNVRAGIDRQTYTKHLAEIRRWLLRGDSYEACYTYQIQARSETDPLDAYLRLRAENPAPFGAYLRFGRLRVLSSSPERFLRVDVDGRAETRPIKGTAPRDPEPGRDREIAARLARAEKYRSENLMIVDLLRNDLGRVCRPGSVRVPALMAVESYATVHHLVTTVIGQLRAGLDAVDCLRALFPGGSMTGAPKKRTVDLLDGLEVTHRGIYSGCLGYLSPDGSADLSIIIRTIVWEGELLSMGVGGAITALSDPVEEYAESKLKALALLRALGVEPDEAERSGRADEEAVVHRSD